MPAQKSPGSLWELGNNFLASMVEARHLLESLESSFCSEVLPAITAAVSNSTHGTLEIADLQRRNAELLTQLEVERARFTLATSTDGTHLEPMEVQNLKPMEVQHLKRCKNLPKTETQCLPIGSGPGKGGPTLGDISNTLVIKYEDQGWRQTHCATAGLGDISHDNFLDTPRDLILAKLAATNVEKCEPWLGGGVNQSPKFAAFTSEEDKSEGFRSTRGPIQALEKQSKKPASMKSPTFKYIEPVRCKRDRENLIATDCKQCRKFYDAVEQGDDRAVHKSQCEHLQAVSRHRFQNLPPDTPLGFWDLGFPDSGIEVCESSTRIPITMQASENASK